MPGTVGSGIAFYFVYIIISIGLSSGALVEDKVFCQNQDFLTLSRVDNIKFGLFSSAFLTHP